MIKSWWATTSALESAEEDETQKIQSIILCNRMRGFWVEGGEKIINLKMIRFGHVLKVAKRYNPHLHRATGEIHKTCSKFKDKRTIHKSHHLEINEEIRNLHKKKTTFSQQFVVRLCRYWNWRWRVLSSCLVVALFMLSLNDFPFTNPNSLSTSS